MHILRGLNATHQCISYANYTLARQRISYAEPFHADPSLSKRDPPMHILLEL